MRHVGPGDLSVLVGIVSGMPAFDAFRASYARIARGKGCCGKGRGPLQPAELVALASHFKAATSKAGSEKVYTALSRLYSTKEPISINLASGHSITLGTNVQNNRT